MKKHLNLRGSVSRCHAPFDSRVHCFVALDETSKALKGSVPIHAVLLELQLFYCLFDMY